MNNGFKKQNNFARASLFLAHYFGVTARVRSVIWKKGVKGTTTATAGENVT